MIEAEGAGDIDHGIDAAKMVGGSGDQPGTSGGVGDIGGNGHSFGAKRGRAGGRFLDTGLINICQCEAGALGGKGKRGGPTQTRRRTGNDYNLAVKFLRAHRGSPIEFLLCMRVFACGAP